MAGHNNGRSQGWGAALTGLLAVLLGGVSGTTAEGTQLGCAEGLCYVHHTQLATWEQAASLCRETPRGELVTVPDYVTQSSLSKVIRYSRIYVSVWIGARNTGTAWTWQDGRSYIGDDVDYYDDPLGRCGYLYTGFRARIAAAKCSDQKKYLCANIAGEFMVRGTRQRSWSESNNDCALRGKVLPMLTADEMQRLSDRLIPDYGHDEYWVGLCRQGWVWAPTGADVVYTNFNGQTPYCTENKCMAINYRGQWFNEDCFSRRGFLCQIPDTGAVPPPVNTPRPIPRPTPPVPTPAVGTPAVTSPPWRRTSPAIKTPSPLDADTPTMSPVPAFGGDDSHDGHDHDDPHNHAVLIGVIVGLAVVITALIVLLVLLILRRKKAKNAEKDDIDNIYSEIREPPSALPQPPNPAMANLYLDNPSPGPSPKPKPRSKPMPLPKPDLKGAGCEMSTFKSANNKRHSMAPPTEPPPEQPASTSCGRANGAPPGGDIGPYAVSYIACTPKDQMDKSATLDSLAALPMAPGPPGSKGHPRAEENRYLLPKEEALRRQLEENLANHRKDEGRRGRKGKGQGKGREAASLMLEENDLYSDVAGD